jgi:hypothetical protein
MPKASAAWPAIMASKTCTVRPTSCSAAPIATAATPPPRWKAVLRFRHRQDQYDAFKAASHVQPLNKEFWKTSANPANSTVLLNHESPEFIQFVNPGDLRVAEKACGLCHGAEAHKHGAAGGDIIDQVTHSMMNHGAMLWAAAAYNNGAFHLKNPLFGQDYSADGEPLALLSPRPVTPRKPARQGFLPSCCRCPALKSASPATSSASSKKAASSPATRQSRSR